MLATSAATLSSSMPLFPGAWPDYSESGHTDASSVVSAPDVCNASTTLDSENEEYSSHHRTFNGEPIIVPVFRIVSGNSAASNDAEACDQVSDPQVAVASSYTSERREGVTNLDVTTPLLSASVSHDSCMSASSVTTVSSDAITTPESTYRAIWHPHVDGDSKQDSFSSARNSVQTPQELELDHYSGLASPATPMNDRLLPSFVSRNAASRKESRDKLNSYLDPPLLNLLPRSPPLQTALQNHPGARIDPSHIDTESPPAPPSPFSPAVSIPSSFAIPSPVMDDSRYFTEMYNSRESSPMALARDFFPLPAFDPSSNDHRSLADFSSASIESHELSTDSPVLPVELSERVTSIHENGPQQRTHHLSQPFTPTSADLDAFAHAAEAAALVSESSLVLSSTIERPELHMYECPSLESLTPVGETSSSDEQYDADEDGSFEENYDEFGRDQGSRSASARRTKPRHSNSIPLPPRALQRSISSHVEVGVHYFPDRGHGKKGTTGRFSTLRKLGGRIKNLFKSSKGDEFDMQKGFQVKAVTSTTVTNVEYTSHHPIPDSVLQHRRRSGLILRPPPALDRSHNRRDSFLPIDANDSRPIISIPFPHHRHGNRSKTRRSASVGRNRYIPSPANTSPPPPRVRTQTEPRTYPSERQHAMDASRRGSRHFSLSSVLSSHHLEMLRATVSPHPPLPLLPPRPPYLASSGQSIRGRHSDEISSRPKSTLLGPARMAVSTSTNATQVLQDSPTEPSSPSHIGIPESPILSAMYRRRAEEEKASHPSPVLLPTPNHSPTSNRNRHFSLSSAISRRAKSVMNVVGRRFAEDEGVGSEPSTPIGSPQTPRGRPRGASIVTADGVSFDMLTPSPPLPEGPFITGHGGENDSLYYDVDERDISPSLQESELDTMSFARTPGSSSFQFNSTGSLGVMQDSVDYPSPASLKRRDEGDETIKTASTMLGQSLTSTKAAASTVMDETSNDDRSQKPEAKGFVQALGFEFDEIARRARENTL